MTERAPAGVSSRVPRDELRALLTRRQALTRASTAGLGALVALALPLARDPPAARALGLPQLPELPTAATPNVADATLQAFADTMLPGCPATRTDLGNPIYPGAIAGVDPLPGAVQADALAAYHHPEIGFDSLEPTFLADLEARSIQYGGDFLDLSFEHRVQVCLSGLDFSNPSLEVWEAAAAVPFTAFCAAVLIRNATAAEASGYRVMGLPGTAPNGYTGFSYRRRMSTERTRTGSLP
jgi:enediyne biosynthesis protein E8